MLLNSFSIQRIDNIFLINENFFLKSYWLPFLSTLNLITILVSFNLPSINNDYPKLIFFPLISTFSIFFLEDSTFSFDPIINIANNTN